MTIIKLGINYKTMTQENKINIAKLLKDCPLGMELDCTKYSNVCFVGIDNNKKEPKIKLKIETFGTWCSELTLDKYGKESSHPNAKCLIFPKGKTTWEGFHRPFEDGDIVFTHANCLKVGLGNTWISIFQEKRNGGVATYVDYAEDEDGFYSYNEDKALLCMEEDIMCQRFATEEEKAKLFKAIKDNGYTWNEETKTLEKLPKFKVGDRIKHIVGREEIATVVSVEKLHYNLDSKVGTSSFSISLQHEWELAPNKFDITTLKPFESMVLVRTTNEDIWRPAIYGFSVPNKYYIVGGIYWRQCIPYEGNKHLLGTTNDCDKFYKTW